MNLGEFYLCFLDLQWPQRSNVKVGLTLYTVTDLAHLISRRFDKYNQIIFCTFDLSGLRSGFVIVKNHPRDVLTEFCYKQVFQVVIIKANFSGQT